ncbi:alpha/beta hydrolase [Deinococcus radiophilus]|uniref:alpha/beta hydrolase n=1 Tax=Deinococcus radiophilus TaxID=32062 RepID=UPI003613E480
MAVTPQSVRQRRWLTVLAAGTLALTLGSCAALNPVQTLNRTVSTAGLTVQTDLVYGSTERQKLDIYAPQNVRGAPTVLFIHGGSWANGNKEDYRFVGESLARAGYVVGVMNYRLAPQFRYPSYIQDSAQALAFLRSQAARYGGSPDNLFLMGHSAGPSTP